MKLRSAIALMGLGIGFILVSGEAKAQDTRPNVIMIYTDDMGYSDISSFSNTDLPVTTPNIDRLATEGMKFTHFYVSMPICSPSRAAVLSGMFSPRNRLTNFLEFRSRNNSSDQNDHMEPAYSYLPKAFQTAGYATGHVGKWHLGGGRDVDNPPTIRQYGYDEAYSTWESPNPDPQLGVKYTPWDYNNLEPGQVPRHQRTEYMVNRTLDFLNRNQGKPCFITLWPDDVHTPFTPNAVMIAKYGGTSDGANTRPNFYGVLEEYDRQIGRLLTELDQRGLADNTIIFFTGDNGPAPDFGTERTNGMNGNKLSLYEGGIREPFLIRWPGHIPAGVTNATTVMSTVDLLPTLTGLAGVPLSPEAIANMDGEDLSAAMLGNPVTRQKPLFWEYGRTSSVPRPGVNDVDRSPILAMREGDLKLLMNPDGTEKELYNVRTNPRENNNIAAQNTTIVNDMATRLLAWRNALPHRNQPFPVFETVNFAQHSITEFKTIAELQAGAGANTTLRIDGVTLAAHGEDDVFAIHTDVQENETFVRIDGASGAVSKISDSAIIGTNLGLGTGNRTLRAGFEYSMAGDRLFFSEDSSFAGQTMLGYLPLGSRFARQVVRSSTIFGLNDLTVLPDGTVAGVRGSEGNKTVGTIVPATGVWTQRLTEAQLKTAAPGTNTLIPEAIAANTSGGESYVFAHGDGELFRVASVNSASASPVRQSQAALATADFHDIAVDQAGNVFGLDVADNQIVVIPNGGSIVKLSLSQIGQAVGLGGPLGVTPWRGLAARMADSTHADLFLACADGSRGIVRIRFGNYLASVGDWNLY